MKYNFFMVYLITTIIFNCMCFHQYGKHKRDIALDSIHNNNNNNSTDSLSIHELNNETNLKNNNTSTDGNEETTTDRNEKNTIDESVKHLKVKREHRKLQLQKGLISNHDKKNEKKNLVSSKSLSSVTNNHNLDSELMRMQSEDPVLFNDLLDLLAKEDFREMLRRDAIEDSKPDLDIFLYQNLPYVYKRLYDDEKEKISSISAPYAQYRNKRISERKAPFPKAIEMVVKTGMDDDETDSDNFEQIPIVFNLMANNPNAVQRSNELCPMHSIKKEAIEDPNNGEQKIIQVCSCHLLKKSPMQKQITEKDEYE